eukprot:6201344-Pleurochrysis_carterae.AAC.1
MKRLAPMLSGVVAARGSINFDRRCATDTKKSRRVQHAGGVSLDPLPDSNRGTQRAGADMGGHSQPRRAT